MLSTGEEYAVVRRYPIELEVFESLYRAVPELVKRSGFVGAEDLLDGESYLVKWASASERTQLVLSNPREIENDAFRHIGEKLDRLMEATRKAKALAERFLHPSATSPLQRSSTRDIVE
jgi:hypothetical protein